MSRDSVPSPYKAHVHPYPTRHHGGQWVRPVFGKPYVHHVQNQLRDVKVLKRGGGSEQMLLGLGADPEPVVVDTEGLPLIVDAPADDGTEAKPIRRIRKGPPPDAPWGGNNGLFRTHGDGGGIFNRALAGLSGDGVGTLLVFALGAAAGYGAYWFLSKK